MKKVIFAFLGGYLPAQNYGGPVTSIANMVEDLSDEFEFRIVTSNHDLKSTEPLEGIHDGWNDVNGAKVLYLNNGEFTRAKFEEILREFHADLAYLSGVFNHRLNFPAYRAARKLKIPILLAPRGELCANALGLKKTKKKVYLFLFRFIGYFKKMCYQATSKEERQDIINLLHVKEEKVYLLPNMHGTAVAKSDRIKEKGKLKIIFLARIAKKKNLLYAIDIVKQLHGDITFDIYGPIEDEEYWRQCCNSIESAPDNVKISYCGQVSPSDAKYVYADYDCLFFPTLSENYGHVIVEAMLANCPVVISKGTTPWDDVNGQGGFTVDLDNRNGFIEVLENLVAKDYDSYMNDVKKLKFFCEFNFKGEELKYKYGQMFYEVSGV